MKNLLKLSLIFLLILSSCSKDNSDEITSESNEGVSPELVTNLANSARTARSSNQDSDYLEDGQCFVMNYPYSISDGQTSTTINNDEELEAYFENLTSGATFSIDLPFSVTLADGNQQTISTFDEFYTLISDCINSIDSPDACFDLNFPLTALDMNGNEVTVNSEQDMFTVQLAGFVYPISVTLSDGTQVDINSAEDFDSLYNDCYGIEDCDDCGVLCFEVVFPFTFVSDSGDIQTINDYDQLWAFLSSLTEDDTYVISYPVNVEFEDGSQQTANSDEEFAALYDSCE